MRRGITREARNDASPMFATLDPASKCRAQPAPIDALVPVRRINGSTLRLIVVRAMQPFIVRVLRDHR